MFNLVQINNYLFQQPMRSHGIVMWLCLQFTVWDFFIQTTENGHFAAPKTLNILAKKDKITLIPVKRAITHD